MIYTKPQDHVIKITALDFGRGATTVVDGLDMPFGLAIDHYGQNLYWTDQGKIYPSAAAATAMKSTCLERNSLKFDINS